MSAFDRNAFGPVIGELLAEERLNPLGPGTPNRDAKPRLDELSIETAFAGRTVRDRDLAAGCLSGLWLVHDYLDASHGISQNLETVEGSYWHGIMHRREPDYGNSKYWFRRVGNHPVFEPLRTDAAALASVAETDEASDFLTRQSAWDPFAFIDLCEACARGRSSAETLCMQIQRREWELLFAFCFRGAVGTTA